MRQRMRFSEAHTHASCLNCLRQFTSVCFGQAVVTSHWAARGCSLTNLVLIPASFVSRLHSLLTLGHMVSCTKILFSFTCVWTTNNHARKNPPTNDGKCDGAVELITTNTVPHSFRLTEESTLIGAGRDRKINQPHGCCGVT